MWFQKLNFSSGKWTKMTNKQGKVIFHYRLCPGTYGHALIERKNFGPTDVHWNPKCSPNILLSVAAKKLICKLLGITVWELHTINDCRCCKEIPGWWIHISALCCMHADDCHNTKSFMNERHRWYGLWWCYICGLTLNEGYIDIRK